jgi:hypothetical protein
MGNPTFKALYKRFDALHDRFEAAGEREVKKALRKSLFKYKLHADEELFEKAYSYY